jgi:hypothetical protein
MFRPSSLLSAVLALVPLHSYADTVTITPTADTCLFERDPNNNWGAEPEIVAGVLGDTADNTRSRILLKFDIGSNLPAGSTITAAELEMTITRTPPSAPATSFQLLRVLVDWAEGGGDGGSPGGFPAAIGETTWQNRFHPASAWASPGGGEEVDFAEDPSSTHLVSANPSEDRLDDKLTNIFQFNPEGISNLYSMLAAPENDFGWVLLAQNETPGSTTARRWAARENADQTLRPKLTITFTPPAGTASTPEILEAELDPGNDNLTVTFSSESGQTYALETRLDLNSGDWIAAVTDIFGTPGSTSVSTPTPVGADRLFFRVRRL